MYLVIMDRFSGWPVVVHCGGSTGSLSQLKDSLRDYFAMQKFLKDYRVKHQLSSVALPRSNKRVELLVKSI